MAVVLELIRLPAPSSCIKQPTPAVEGIDQWFDTFQQFEATLEGMAKASMDVKFKEELTAIEQWFRVLSEYERTASLYSLMQNATQNQIRFFIAVLQQMAKADPMTAGVSPAAGIPPMQQGQVKPRLNTLSPLARTFSPGNISAPADTNKNHPFFSPTDTTSPTISRDSAATLAQQRARLRAMQSANRLPVPASAPILEEGRHAWGPGAHPLAKKITEASIEEEAPSSADTAESPVLATPSTSDNTAVDPESWSSMVQTPLFSMFPKDKLQVSMDGADLQPWSAEGIVPQIGDAAIYRKAMKGNKKNTDNGAPPAKGDLHTYLLDDSSPLQTPYNLNMMSAMGMSPEQQLRAVQMFVNGYVPTQQHPGGRWRGGAKSGGAPPKSATSSSSATGKSAGLKSSASSNTPSGVINRENETDLELLKDIPAWLKALRLHKYSSSFEGMTWQDMVVLDEAQLETRGVVTVGARKRFLRLFESVRKSHGMLGDEKETAVVEPVPENVTIAAGVPVAVC